MTVFADASAIAKLYLAEPGSDGVATESGPFAVSTITRIEVASAIWRRARDGGVASHLTSEAITGMQRDLARGRFGNGAEVFEVIMAEQVRASAVRLCGVHGLRAGDAIQLATALLARRVDETCTRFWVFDRRLADAAAREGFAILGLDGA